MFDVLSTILRTKLLTEPSQISAPDTRVEVESLQRNLWNILGRAVSIRHVDAGSCNGCELEIQAINNPYYNLEGLGIKFVASPRHADVLLVTGPVSVNMEEALRRTYNAMPDPKLVVAVGDCGACGGVFGESYASRGSVANVIAVNHSIVGCPPTPSAILAGILNTIRSAQKSAQPAGPLDSESRDKINV